MKNHGFSWILYQPYKWLIYVPFLIVNSLFFSLVAIILTMVAGQKVANKIVGIYWSRSCAFMVPMQVKVKGKENINNNTSYVIVANHQSMFDIFLLYGWLGLDIRWMMKKELFNVPGIGYASKKVGHIFIDRSNPKNAMNSLNEAKEKLRNGTSVVIFPEGTRSRTGEIGHFKRGAFKLAIELGLPLLPLTIIGTRKILPSSGFDLFPGKVELRIHSPITNSLLEMEKCRELMDKTREIISKVEQIH
jgi:1-acyl-sn-glycerol-3-phosphate acyltransferase